MNEEYEGSMDDEKCENCTYYRNDICLRKAGADEKILLPDRHTEWRIYF